METEHASKMGEHVLKNKGQGVFIYNIKSHNNDNPIFTLYDTLKTNGIKVELNGKNLEVSLLNPYRLLVDISSQAIGLIHPDIPYWFSIDSQNRRLYAGVGEPRLETVHYRFTFKDGIYKKMLESFISIEHNSRIEYKKVLKDPITRRIPLKVKDIDELTMEDIARGEYMPKANLSLVSQKLYDCIAGKRFILNTPDFPDFSKAIEYSIRTPGCWCNTTLKEKATEFNKDKPNIKETYLRITLGENNGESPGVPYVMEIWPVGHYSPIHSHAGADAVIRVLHGGIHVKLFPYLTANKIPAPFGTADFKEGDITWISPTLNQIHQLENLETNKDTCITIQCYMYNSKDKKHYDYFDYIDADGEIETYEPDSDMEFIAFKERMKLEWAEVKYVKYNYI
jgi:hypothetical protein